MWQKKIFTAYEVAETIHHPSSDLALMELSQTVVFDGTVRPVCLPVEKPTFQVDSNATVASFGPIADQSKYNIYLYNSYFTFFSENRIFYVLSIR